jgi:hypothetical protein
MRARTLLVSAVLTLLVAVYAGCDKCKWTTIYFVNLSKLEITGDLEGIRPYVPVGRLMPGDGTEQLLEVTAHYCEPVRIDNTITMLWTVLGNSTTNKAEFKRDDLGMPAKVNGGKITITFTSNCTWQIVYVPWSPEMDEDDEDDDSGE